MRAFFLSMLAVWPLIAQKQSAPPPGPPRPFVFPKAERKALPNGLTVFVIEDHRQPVVSYRLIVPAGVTAHDPKSAGLADMTATLLRNGGTKTRNSQEIAKLADGAGGSLGATASEDTASVFATFLKSKADLGLELLADIVMNPVFDPKELDRIRQQALSGLQLGYGDPVFLINRLGPRLVFGQHPYAYPRDGTPDTVRGLKREEIVAFHKARYAPAAAFLAIAGDVTPAEGFGKAEKYLGGWSGSLGAAPTSPAPPAPQARIVVVDKPDAVQTRIYVGQLGVTRGSPDYIALTVANQIYGGGYTSRLNMKLRATEGLTYGASGLSHAYREAGALVTDTFTRTEKTVEAIRAILQLQKDFVANPSTEQELEDAKAFLIGTFKLSIETPDAVAGRTLTSALYGFPADYWQTMPDKIRAVTPEQIAALVKKYYQPDKVTIAVVGDAAKFEKDLAALGKVTTIKVAEFDEMPADLAKPKAAAPVATAEAKMRAAALIRAAAQAIGGVDAVRSVKDLASKSTTLMKGPQGEMKAEGVEEIAYPDKYRTVLSIGQMQMAQVFDGKSIWVKQGTMVRDMPPQLSGEIRKSILIAAGIGLLREALDGRADVQALDDGSVLWQQGEMSVKLFFDPQTHRIAKMQYRSAGPTGAAEAEHTLLDYRDSGGVQLPWKETLNQGGMSVERTFTERRVNSGVDAGVFAKPQ